MIQQHNRFALRVLHRVENFGLGIILLVTLVAGFQSCASWPVRTLSR